MVTRETDLQARAVTRETDPRARAATRETDLRVRAATRETDPRVRAAIRDTEDRRAAAIRMTKMVITTAVQDHREHVPEETQHLKTLTLRFRQNRPVTEPQRITIKMADLIKETKMTSAREEQQQKGAKHRFCLQFM